MNSKARKKTKQRTPRHARASVVHSQHTRGSLERTINMKTGTDTRETARERAMSEIADKALKNYEQLVRTGLKLQEEAGRCWTSLLTQTASVQDFQRPMNNFTAVANGILPEAQKRMQEMVSLVEANSRTGVELMKKAADAVQTPGIAESQ